MSIPKKAIHKIQSMETEKTDFIYSERTNKRQRFDRRLVEHIVSLVEQGVPRRDLMEQYGVANNTLMNWMNKYGSGLTKRKSYTQAEKRTVVRALASGMSTGEAQAAYNISCSTLILRWRKKFEEENSEISLVKHLEMSKKPSDQLENDDVKALQKALEMANLKIKALDTMIDIAEEQLKIDIRKKSGAKQSSK